MSEKEITKVMFRMWRVDGKTELIALFPEIPSDGNWKNCLSYQTIGQHSGACLHHILFNSRPATESEYEDLFTELTGIGYNLEVVQRNKMEFTSVRIKQIHK